MSAEPKERLASPLPPQNNVPKGGASVVQLGGSGTRELYYYPKDLGKLIATGEGVNKGLIEQAGITAGVPVVAKPGAPEKGLAEWAAEGSLDAVVSLGTMAGMTPMQRSAFLDAAARALKPGGRLIFVEKQESGASPLRGLVGASGPALDDASIAALRSAPGFATCTIDVALEGQDPHAVGLAIRGEGRVQRRPQPSASSGGSSSGGGSGGASSSNPKKPSDKGFGKL